MTEHQHCDNYIGDKTQPKCLRKFLLFHRIPAYQRFKWQSDKKWPVPVLYATYDEPNGPGGRKGKTKRVKCTMASRFGDVGITIKLDAETGYDLRVMVGQLRDFSEEP